MAKISCDFYPFLTAAHNFSVFEKKEDIYAVNLMTLLVILLTKGQSLPLCVFKKKKKSLTMSIKILYCLGNVLFIELESKCLLNYYLCNSLFWQFFLCFTSASV